MSAHIGPAARRRVLRLAIQRDILPTAQFVDVRAAFASDRQTLFNDEVHLTPRGNDVLARAAADALRERGMVPR